MITREHRAVFSDELRQRRRGRPRAAVPMVSTTFRLPEPVYDALCRLAMQRRQPMQALLRDVLSTYTRADA